MAALRRFLPRTIFARTLIMIVVPLVLLQVVVAFMFYGRLWEIVSRRLATGLVAHVAIVAHALENFPEDDERREWILEATVDAANLAIEFKPGVKLPPGERQSTWIVRPVECFHHSAKASPNSWRIDSLCGVRITKRSSARDALLVAVSRRKSNGSATIAASNAKMIKARRFMV